MDSSVEITSRPLRIAFLVDPKDKKSIRKAIQINSTLWGGSYNPLVPLFKRVPKDWDFPLKKSIKPKEIVKGYVEAFDVDAIVACTKDIPDYISEFGRSIIKAEDIWKGFTLKTDDGLIPGIGIGIFEMLEPIFDEYFKYKMKFPKKILIYKINKSGTLGLFWASLLGEYPQDISEYIFEHYQEEFGIEEKKVEETSMKDLFGGGGNFSPRNITKYKLETRSSDWFKDYIFFMDANSGMDVIDYWNLRASGKSVVPVPIQLQENEDIKEIVRNFILSANRPLRGNSKVFVHATFLKSRSIDNPDLMKEYAESLQIPKKPPKEIPYAFQNWHPRIWQEWGRDRDGVEPVDIVHEESEVKVSKDSENFYLKPAKPSFAWQFASHSLQYANELRMKVYERGKMLAQVYPKNGGDKVKRTIADFSEPEKWRIGKNGLVRLERGNMGDFISAPPAEKVFYAWLEELGYKEIQPSSPGIIAKQLYRRLEGFPSFLREVELLKFLESMNDGSYECGMAVGEVKRRFDAFAGKRGNLLPGLIKKGVFKIGAKIQCPWCTRHSFYEVGSLKEQLECPKCLQSFPAIGNLTDKCWHYKTTGPFSIPQFGDGAYAVLLSVDFFMTTMMHGAGVTPTYSFKAKKGNEDFEVDFAMLWQESYFKEVSEGVIFGECKSFGKFAKKDFQRMGKIMKDFPGAVIAFCTLRDRLEKDEVRELTKLVKKGRKYYHDEKPINPILILTANEIFDYSRPPYCWRKLGLKENFDRVHSLLDICNATQQIYLGLPSWHKDWEEYFSKRRARRRKK